MGKNDNKIAEKISEIKNCFRNCAIYSKSLKQSIFDFTNAFDYMFSEIVITENNLSDLYREGYQTAIKNSFALNHDGGFNQRFNYENIKEFDAEFRELREFNFMRNTFDRYQNGNYDAVMNNNVLEFTFNKEMTNIYRDIYSRAICNNLPFSKYDKDEITTQPIFDYIGFYLMRNLNFESKKIFKPHNSEWRKCIDMCFQTFTHSFPRYVKFADYSIADFLLVYASLKSLAVYKIAYFMKKKVCKLTISPDEFPSVFYPKVRLINDIASVVELKTKTVESIINDLIYDYDFEKNMISLYQPLFEIDGNILFSSYLLCFSNEQDKLVKVFSYNNKEKNAISEISIYKAELMTTAYEQIIENFFPNLTTFRNCKLFLNGLVNKEIDLVIADDKNKILLLTELKWRQKVDNEFDSFKKERLINGDILSRIEAEKAVKENLDLFIKQNSLPTKYANYIVESIIIEKEYSGGANSNSDIPVLDDPLFKFTLYVSNGDLKIFLDSLKSDDILDAVKNSVKIPPVSRYKYRDYKIVVKYWTICSNL